MLMLTDNLVRRRSRGETFVTCRKPDLSHICHPTAKCHCLLVVLVNHARPLTPILHLQNPHRGPFHGHFSDESMTRYILQFTIRLNAAPVALFEPFPYGEDTGHRGLLKRQPRALCRCYSLIMMKLTPPTTLRLMKPVSANSACCPGRTWASLGSMITHASVRSPGGIT